MEPTRVEEMGFSKQRTVTKLETAGIHDLADLASYNEARLRNEVKLDRAEIVEVKEVVVGAGLAPGMPREMVLEELSKR